MDRIVSATITNRTKGRQVGGGDQNDNREPDLSNRDVLSPKWGSAARFAGAAWQLPRGVVSGTWDYIRGNQVAAGYERFLENDPLTLVDRKIIDRYLPNLDPSPESTPPTVADFGCGAGRHVFQLAAAGYRVLAVDLSHPMLNILTEKYYKTSNRTGRIHPLLANLVELEAFQDQSLDHAICLFSTLGMIHGQIHRDRFLAHVRRLVKPGGKFIVHVHNLWNQAQHPGGKRWLAASGWAALRGKIQFGDRYATYRGVNNMYIHSFRRRELNRDLRRAGFQNLQWFGVAAHATEPQPVRWWNPVPLVGWIVVAN